MYDDHSIFFHLLHGKRESEINRYEGPLDFLDIDRYMYGTHGKQNANGQNKYQKHCQSTRKNTHKHLLYLIHFAVHPLAAFLR